MDQVAEPDKSPRALRDEHEQPADQAAPPRAGSSGKEGQYICVVGSAPEVERSHISQVGQIRSEETKLASTGEVQPPEWSRSVRRKEACPARQQERTAGLRPCCHLLLRGLGHPSSSIGGETAHAQHRVRFESMFEGTTDAARSSITVIPSTRTATGTR